MKLQYKKEMKCFSFRLVFESLEDEDEGDKKLI